ncbi:zinc-ribbon domain-containing protein [Malonomonas rubra]|uniref:zinc-ribbon domain-containing protein n=1 Tax=Malonomonas rubra TaxID=57040 RepID=UPI0026F363C4|nr:zinc-ribbon domain-containing protein [Malonomonas rubra]
MPIISCPHCGAQRTLPSAKFPRKPAIARCPECRKSFHFDPAILPLPAADSSQVCCPSCGLPCSIPAHRKAGERPTVHCRRCKHSFRLETPPSAETVNLQALAKLQGIGRLLTDSWELFCQRGWGLTTIYLLGILLLFTPLLLAFILLPPQWYEESRQFWSVAIVTSAFGLLGSAWLAASMLSYICRKDLGIFGAINRGRRQLWQFFALILLLGLTVGGGSLLLVIPGIIFTVWFFFCQYVLADEELSGIQAMARSRQLVHGHWWAVLGRFLLLPLVTLSIFTLTARLPIIGAPLNFIFSLLITPFSLLYYYQIYRNLKQNCAEQPLRPATSFSFSLATAVLGWMLIPGLLFAAKSWQQLPTASIEAESSAIVGKLFNHQQAILLEQAEMQTEPQSLQKPEFLTKADYDRLLKTKLFPAPQKGGLLGPATLSAEHFWADEQEPHLWLKLKLAEFPNLALAHSHSTRILIDKVLDASAEDRYDRAHSFEHNAFQWIDILSDSAQTDGYSGIRNVYLKQGTRPEQIRSIIGHLELNLPLGIESLQLNRNDIGKTLQVAGKTLTLENINEEGVTVRYQGRRSELLSIRAVNQQAEPLREAGSTWLKNGDSFSFRQMFSGDIVSVTILVASDSITRSYPFEITQ